MKHLILLFILIALFCGCVAKHNNPINGTFNTYDIDYGTDAPYFWDEYFDYSHHVVLETTENSFFKEISKLVIKDKRIYILCRSLHKVLIFDMTGKFLNVINRYGEGPEEYISAVDISVEDGDIVKVLDNVSGKINSYTSLGEFLNVKPCVPANAFLYVGEDSYIFNRNNLREDIKTSQPFNFIYMKGDSVVTKDIRYIQSMAGRVFRYGDGNSLIYSHGCQISVPHNDTLYTFDKTDKRLLRSCLFNFGIQRPDGSMSQVDVEDYLKKSRIGEIPSSLYGLQMVDDYIFGVFNYQQGVRHVLISLADGKVTVSKPVLNKEGLPVLPVANTNDWGDKEYMVTAIPASFIKSQENVEMNSVLDSINVKLENEECNPTLIFYKLKKSR